MAKFLLDYFDERRIKLIKWCIQLKILFCAC